ncbi:hypothetical protein J6590_062714 [Homalodisca vitripennis]|nr:hypothetical protein J6590_062714 [Homalodisca vitripennis]
MCPMLLPGWGTPVQLPAVLDLALSPTYTSLINQLLSQKRTPTDGTPQGSRDPTTTKNCPGRPVAILRSITQSVCSKRPLLVDLARNRPKFPVHVIACNEGLALVMNRSDPVIVRYGLKRRRQSRLEKRMTNKKKTAGSKRRTVYSANYCKGSYGVESQSELDTFPITVDLTEVRSTIKV